MNILFIFVMICGQPQSIIEYNYTKETSHVIASTEFNEKKTIDHVMGMIRKHKAAYVAVKLKDTECM